MATASFDDDLPSADDLLAALGIPPAEKRTDTKPIFFKPAAAMVEPAERPPSVPEPVVKPEPVVAEDTISDTVVARPTADELMVAFNTRDDGRETTYQDFCRMLGVPATGQPIPLNTPPLSEEDRLYAVSGAMLMQEASLQKARTAAAAAAEARRAAAPTAAPRGAAADVDGDDRLDDLDELGLDEVTTLEPGGTRDITKSPQHHQLKMDNWAADEAEEEDDVEEEEGEWVDVGDESTGASPQAAAPAAAGADAGTSGAPTPTPLVASPAKPPPASAPATPSAPPPATAAAGSGSPPSPVEVVSPSGATNTETADEPAAAAEEEEEEDTVAPFALDPEFDYDAPVEKSEKFSLERALAEGEYYDCDRPQSLPPKTPPKHGRRAEAKPAEPEPKEALTVDLS